MSFLHWWAVGIGAAALVAPIAVHFLTKPKPIAFSLSTIRFLQEVIEQRKARSRFRDWLILLLRGLCIALLALGLARPLLKQPPMVPIGATGETARVIVLDVSQSMGAGSGGVTAWTQAQASGLQYLDVGSGTKANIVFAGARPRTVFDSLSPNLPGLREAIKQSKPVSERAEPRAALELAGRMLAEVNHEKKELVIISDFQRSNWGSLFLDLVPADVKVQFHSVAQPELANVAINGIRFATEPIVGQPAQLEIELANHSSREMSVRCRIDLADAQGAIEANMLPQTTQTLTKSIVFSQAGWKHGWAKLDNNLDALAADDERPVAIRVRPAVKVLLVTRQNPQEVPSSSFYLERALHVALDSSPNRAEQSDAQTITRVNPLKTAIRSWPDSDVVVLDHPGSLSTEILQGLAAQLRRGKGLLYIASELVDAVNLEQLAQLLGSEFQPPVTLHPADNGSDRKDLFVRRIQSRQVPFSVLGSNSVVPLQAVRFSGGLATRATDEGLRDQVLAELSDTSTLLYLSSVGAGQLALINADLGRSNWTVHPTFLPILSELTQTLLAGSGETTQAACGEPLVRMLPPSLNDGVVLTATTVEGSTPIDDRYGSWEWSAGQGSMVWSWPEPPGAGIYALNDPTSAVCMVATSAPSLEADLQSLDEEILVERVTDQRTVGFTSTKQQSQEKSDATWSWLIVACLLGLIAEIVALRFSRM